MKDALQDPYVRTVVSVLISTGLALIAWKVPAVAPVLAGLGSMLVPAVYKTTKTTSSSE